jgi:hypothetical protein
MSSNVKDAKATAASTQDAAKKLQFYYALGVAHWQLAWAADHPLTEAIQPLTQLLAANRSPVEPAAGLGLPKVFAQSGLCSALSVPIVGLGYDDVARLNEWGRFEAAYAHFLCAMAPAAWEGDPLAAALAQPALAALPPSCLTVRLPLDLWSTSSFRIAAAAREAVFRRRARFLLRFVHGNTVSIANTVTDRSGNLLK